MIHFLAGFPAADGGHGGNLRSAQIAELLESVCEVNNSRVPMITRFRVPSLFAFRCVGRAGIECLRKFVRHLPSAFRYADRLQLIPTAHLLATEQYYSDPALILAATGMMPTAVFPQNIESLVPNKANRLHHNPKKDFILEKTLISVSKCCVTISEEDEALVRSECVNTLTLPYYPTHDRFSLLMELRAARQGKEKKHLLILGTVNNPPTRIGVETMLSGLSHFLESNDNPISTPVILAGHGTEVFEGKLPATVQLEGSVSPERLRELQLQAKAMLIYQPETTGSLTRVVESLICGIPIVANESALRGYDLSDGIRTSNDILEFWDLAFSNADAIVPAVPERPIDAEEKVRKVLRAILDESL